MTPIRASRSSHWDRPYLCSSGTTQGFLRGQAGRLYSERNQTYGPHWFRVYDLGFRVGGSTIRLYACLDALLLKAHFLRVPVLWVRPPPTNSDLKVDRQLQTTIGSLCNPKLYHCLGRSLGYYCVFPHGLNNGPYIRIHFRGL